MLIRGKPKNIDNYICVDNNISNKLQKNGFKPHYLYNDKFWYLKTKDILEFMEVNNL